MRAQFVIPVIASILILGTLVTGFTPNASAAQGTIIFVNPAETQGIIQEDGCEGTSGECRYQFLIPRGLADPNYNPQVDDKVTFTPGAGQTASNIVAESQVLASFEVEIFVDRVKQSFTSSQLQSSTGGSATQDASGTVRLSLNVVCDPIGVRCFGGASVLVRDFSSFPAGTTVNFKIIQIEGIPQDNLIALCSFNSIVTGNIFSFEISPDKIGDNVHTLTSDEPDGIEIICTLETFSF